MRRGVPVDCIHPTPDEPDYEAVEQLFIDPDECIDCDACVEACPVDACFAEDQLPEEWAKYTAINAEYFAGSSPPASARLDDRQLGAADRGRCRHRGRLGLKHGQLLRRGGDDPARGGPDGLRGRGVGF